MSSDPATAGSFGEKLGVGVQRLMARRMRKKNH